MRGSAHARPARAGAPGRGAAAPSGDLIEYHRKRDFTRTPEPRGRARPGRPGAVFVVQKHAATRLHYDFRLELDGVLKSWAVPKGPSYDPHDRRLAMRTEDHPLEYGGFEGIIPRGEYGGGTVLLWDRGTWTALGDPRQGLATGAIKFVLEGEKLRGAWTLVKIRGRDARDAEKTWLLIKERDATAQPASSLDITRTRPESVASGRDLDDIAQAGDRVWHSGARADPRSRTRSRFAGPAPAAPLLTPRPLVAPEAIPGARRVQLPTRVIPQLPTLTTAPPAGDGWLHEMKFDGYRILCRIQGGRARLLSRTGRDWTEQFPGIAPAAVGLPVREAFLDGEVAVLLPGGTTSFGALQDAMGGGDQGPVVYFVFDLLYQDGYDLRGAPLEARKAALRAVLDRAPTGGPLRYSDHVVGQGAAFFEAARRLGLEGVVSKRRDAPYQSGRGRGWLKAKCLQAQEFVIGGFTEPQGGRVGLGALLLGVRDAGKQLRYVGRVGTGFTTSEAGRLRQELDRLEAQACPFAARPTDVPRGVHWVRPRLVAQVSFTEWTADGRLRHPAFNGLGGRRGLRDDKAAREIVGETPAAGRRPRA